MTDWLTSFYENQKDIKCTCCSDCDNERDAAHARIRELEDAMLQLVGQHPDGSYYAAFDPDGDLINEFVIPALQRRAAA